MISQEILLHAVENNNEPLVRHLLKRRNGESKGSDSGGTGDFNGGTPLMIALKEGHIGVAKTILGEKDKRERKGGKCIKVMRDIDNDGNNVFHQAFVSPKREEATKLLVSKCSPEELKKFLTAKNIKHEATPFHILAEHRDDETAKKIVSVLTKDQLINQKDIMECMEATNHKGETPFHIAAKCSNVNFVASILEIDNINRIQIGRLMAETDKDGNTVLHVAARMGEEQQQTSNAPRSGVLNLLVEFLKKNKIEALKIFNSKNIYGHTPLYEAAKKGHVNMFTTLLDNGADLLREQGDSGRTALDVAIDEEQREIIKAIIKAKNWQEAFQKPYTSADQELDLGQELDTPLRRLIRKMPDMAEEVLDECYAKVDNIEAEANTIEKMEMNYDLVEDSHKYSWYHSDSWFGSYRRRQFCERNKTVIDSNGYSPKKWKYHDNVDNHPMMIMAAEEKWDLLLHPLCLAIILRKWMKFGRWMYYGKLTFYMVFLAFLNVHILTSPSPIKNPGMFNCTEFFNTTSYLTNVTIHASENSAWNDRSRRAVFVMFGLKMGLGDWLWTGTLYRVAKGLLFMVIAVFILLFEILSLLTKGAQKLFFKSRRNSQTSWSSTTVERYRQEWRWIKRTLNDALYLENLVVITNMAVYGLAFYVVFENTSTFNKSDGATTTVDVRSCKQWQIGALTMTLAWINLLFHMRLSHKIGKYVILFQDILVSFLLVFLVILILLIGFGLSFHMLLSHRDNFAEPEDALLKTMMMMSGEIEYGEMFWKDRPPQGWDQDWDQGAEHVPFPVVTYTIFIAFFGLVCLVALNVFVGLAVDETRKFVETAQIRKLTMRMRFVLELEHHWSFSWFFGKNDKKSYLKDVIKKGTSFEKGLTEDLPPTTFENRIFERKVKIEESKKKMKETEQEKEFMKKLLRDVSDKFNTSELQNILKMKPSDIPNILEQMDPMTNQKPASSKIMTEDETSKTNH